MTKGLEIRAQIDTENVKGLLLINGGGVIALLALLPSVLGKRGLEPFVHAIIVGIIAFIVGIAAAVIHNRLRRICSLRYEEHNYNPPPCRFAPAFLKLRQPCICSASIAFMWLSFVAFLAAGVIVACGALGVLGYAADPEGVPCWTIQKIDDQVLRINQCTGSWEIIALPPATQNNTAP